MLPARAPTTLRSSARCALTKTVSGLAAFEGRGAGTDSERRAARWLATELSAAGGEVIVEPFWSRPNWALANAWHVALAIAGSLVSVPSPIAGGAMLVAALAFVLVDAITGVSPGRRLTPERASQNVIAVAPPAPGANTRLILTANYDAGRVGLAYRDAFRRASSSLRRSVRGLTPGWLGWLVIAILWLLAVAFLRLEGHKSQAIGAIQLPPTVALVLGFALLLELATADWSPAAGDNGSGVAVAVELARALGAAPPAHLAVELVLTGAGDGEQLGLRRYLRAHRAEQSAANTVVLGVAAVRGRETPLVAQRRGAGAAAVRASATRARGADRRRGASPRDRPAWRSRGGAGVSGTPSAAARDRDRLPRRPRASPRGRTTATTQRPRSTRTQSMRPFSSGCCWSTGSTRRLATLRGSRALHRRDRISLVRPLAILPRGEREPADQLTRAAPRAG